jgi:hypothetical protein
MIPKKGQILLICLMICMMMLCISACSRQTDTRSQLIGLYEEIREIVSKFSVNIEEKGGHFKPEEARQALDRLAQVDEQLVKLPDNEELSTAQKELANHLRSLVSLHVGFLRLASAAYEKAEFGGPVPEGVIITKRQWPYGFTDNGAPANYDNLVNRFSVEILKEGDATRLAIFDVNKGK